MKFRESLQQIIKPIEGVTGTPNFQSVGQKYGKARTLNWHLKREEPYTVYANSKELVSELN